MKHPKIYEMLQAIFDKRLYLSSSFFLQTCPLLALGLGIEVAISVALDPPMLFIYVPLFVMMTLFSGLAAKNYGSEMHNIGYYRGFLFLAASALASVTPFVLIKPLSSLNALFQYFLTFTIATVALIAIVEVTVWGQRASLRRSMKLDQNFFKKQKKVWKETGRFSKYGEDNSRR